LLPGVTAVLRAVDAAIGVRPRRRAERRDVHEVRVLRMRLDCADLTGRAQAEELPCLSRIRRLVHAAARDDVAADALAARADVDDGRVGFVDVDRSDGRGLEDAV